MTDLIYLPNNDKNFYRKAMNALEQNDLKQANHFLKESYQMQPSIKVFKELIHLNMLTKNSQQLKQLWQNFLNDYQMESFDQELALIYANSIDQIKPQNARLLALYQVQDLFLQKNWNTVSIKKLIQQAKTQDLLAEKIQNHIKNRQVSRLVDEMLEQSVFDLLKAIKFIYPLEFSIKHPVFEALLRHQSTPQFVKSDILHHYLFQNYHVELKLRWFDSEETIITKDLIPYRENTTYLKIKSLLEDYTNNNNPHILQGLMEEINLLIMVYYPYIDQLIPDPQAWLNEFLILYHIEDLDHSKQNESLKSMLQKVINEVKKVTQAD